MYIRGADQAKRLEDKVRGKVEMVWTGAEEAKKDILDKGF